MSPGRAEDVLVREQQHRLAHLADEARERGAVGLRRRGDQRRQVRAHPRQPRVGDAVRDERPGLAGEEVLQRRGRGLVQAEVEDQRLGHWDLLRAGSSDGGYAKHPGRAQCVMGCGSSARLSAGDGSAAGARGASKVYGGSLDAHSMHKPCTTHTHIKTVITREGQEPERISSLATARRASTVAGARVPRRKGLCSTVRMEDTCLWKRSESEEAMPGRVICRGIVVSLALLASAALAAPGGDISVEGNRFHRDGEPWVPEGVTLVGLVAPRSRENKPSYAAARAEFGEACSPRSGASAPTPCASRSARARSTRSRGGTTPPTTRRCSTPSPGPGRLA